MASELSVSIRKAKLLFDQVLTQLGARGVVLRRLGLMFLFPMGAVAVLSALSPTIEATIDPQTMTPEVGFAFTAPVRPHVRFPFVVRGAAVGQSASGPLTLTENGLPLRRENTNHDLIRNVGGGTYAHWANTLFFSSTDGTDPRDNGRIYRYRVKTA